MTPVSISSAAMPCSKPLCMLYKHLFHLIVEAALLVDILSPFNSGGQHGSDQSRDSSTCGELVDEALGRCTGLWGSKVQILSVTSFCLHIMITQARGLSKDARNLGHKNNCWEKDCGG